MDILRKMFASEKNADKNQHSAEDKEDSMKDEFRKPQWFEEVETDDELFDDDRKFVFQMFTNPMELQKHFERQMQRVLESINDMEQDGSIPMEKNLKEEFLKPGFESGIRKQFEKQSKKLMDTDLDGEIIADDLHYLMQGLKTKDEGLPSILPRNDQLINRIKKKEMTDEEIIMGKLHGTFNDDDGDGKPRHVRPKASRPDMMTPMTPMMPRTPFSGVFQGTYQGPKMFSQKVMTKVIRKPDGSYETTKITEDSDGVRRTTVTRTIDGKTETVTKCEGGNGCANDKAISGSNSKRSQVYSDPNVFVTKEGYAVPRLW